MFNGLLVLIGAAYSWFALGQRDAMIAQLRQMQEEQRASLSFRELSGVSIVDPKTRGIVGRQLLATWRNSGTTPATRAYSHVNFQPDVPAGLDYGDVAGLAPVEIVVGPSEVAPLPLNVGLAPLVNVNNGHPITIWGWITYHDVFLNTPMHLTEFCIELINLEFQPTQPTPQANAPQTTTVKFNYQLCRAKRPCYDRDCSDYDLKVATEHRSK